MPLSKGSINLLITQNMHKLREGFERWPSKERDALVDFKLPDDFRKVEIAPGARHTVIVLAPRSISMITGSTPRRCSKAGTSSPTATGDNPHMSSALTLPRVTIRLRCLRWWTCEVALTCDRSLHPGHGPAQGLRSMTGRFDFAVEATTTTFDASCHDRFTALSSGSSEANRNSRIRSRSFAR
jgi:hypothetical protein